MTGYGLILLWLGAVSLGGLVVVRKQPPSEKPSVWFSPHVRKYLEAACLFVGIGGLIAGLGLLGLGRGH